MYPVADCSCQVVMVVVQGIPVEEVSTDDMRPAAGVPAFRSLSRVMERAQSVNGQRSQMGMSLLMKVYRQYLKKRVGTGIARVAQ